MATAATARPRPGPRLHFLDGLRALASLYVLFFHELSTKVVGHGEPSKVMSFFLPHLNRGRIGVVFFIVLSGFSLALPIARAGRQELVGGFASYLYRRARRIMPPYYAALAFSIAIIAAVNALAVRHGEGAPLEAALRPGSILSHVFLVHNLTFEWAYRINGPMWSVATEWQIYFVFPLLLLPLWRRAGTTVTVVVAWVVSSLPFFLLPADDNFFWACPWFVGSFTLGMVAAVIGLAPQHAASAARNRVPWSLLAWGAFAALVAMCASGLADTWPSPVVDLVVSLLAFSLILSCVRRTDVAGEEGIRDVLLRVLGSRALVYAGGFSYSLYLVQHPILRFTEKALGRTSLGYDANIVVHLLVVTPLVMGVAWVFSELFERPFTSGGVLLPALRRLVPVDVAQARSQPE